MDKLITLLTPFIQSIKRMNKLKQKIGKMITHIMDCNLDSLLKLKKVQRIESFEKEITKPVRLPIKYKLILIDYHDNKWKSIVRENGYLTIAKTIIRNTDESHI